MTRSRHLFSCAEFFNGDHPLHFTTRITIPVFDTDPMLVLLDFFCSWI
jgi:hypothetical protein